MMASPQDLGPQRGQESHCSFLDLMKGGGGAVHLVQGKEGTSQNKRKNPCFSREAGMAASA